MSRLQGNRVFNEPNTPEQEEIPNMLQKMRKSREREVLNIFIGLVFAFLAGMLVRHAATPLPVKVEAGETRVYNNQFYGPLKPGDTMFDKVWIEFGSVQHALDSAAKLGAKGFTVCLGNPALKGTGTWMPPGTSITGNRDQCRYRQVARLAMLYAVRENSVSSMDFRHNEMFDNEGAAIQFGVRE